MRINSVVSSNQKNRHRYYKQKNHFNSNLPFKGNIDVEITPKTWNLWYHCSPAIGKRNFFENFTVNQEAYGIQQKDHHIIFQPENISMIDKNVIEVTDKTGNYIGMYMGYNDFNSEEFKAAYQKAKQTDKNVNFRLLQDDSDCAQEIISALQTFNVDKLNNLMQTIPKLSRIYDRGVHALPLCNATREKLRELISNEKLAKCCEQFAKNISQDDITKLIPDNNDRYINSPSLCRLFFPLMKALYPKMSSEQKAQLYSNLIFTPPKNVLKNARYMNPNGLELALEFAEGDSEEIKNILTMTNTPSGEILLNEAINQSNLTHPDLYPMTKQGKLSIDIILDALFDTEDENFIFDMFEQSEAELDKKSYQETKNSIILGLSKRIRKSNMQISKQNKERLMSSVTSKSPTELKNEKIELLTSDEKDYSEMVKTLFSCSIDDMCPDDQIKLNWLSHYYSDTHKVKASEYDTRELLVIADGMNNPENQIKLLTLDIKGRTETTELGCCASARYPKHTIETKTVYSGFSMLDKVEELIKHDKKAKAFVHEILEKILKNPKTTYSQFTQLFPYYSRLFDFRNKFELERKYYLTRLSSIKDKISADSV